MNRDAQAISSPLETHKNYSFCFAITGIDVGFENPTFACLEVDYEDVDHDSTGAAVKQVQQTLTFYELDLGLNHVVKKYAEPVQGQGNRLISVPGGHDGPSGVIICCENYLVYKNLGDQPDIRCSIPRRQNELDESDRPLMIVCSATHKTKSMYFFLVQSEQGDVFKVTLEANGDIVTEMRFKYFDTLPTANSMCILKTGFLFVASEFGNHQLYQIVHLGENDEEPEFSSRIPLDDGETFFYDTRPLYNLILIDQMDSLSPLISSKIADLANEDAPQIYALCGRGPRSTMRVLRNGLEVSEMAVSELPGNPNAVWIVKKNVDDQYHAHIVVSFVNATLVLSIGETVVEVTDSGFLGTTPTIGCGLIGDDSLLQIYPSRRPALITRRQLQFLVISSLIASVSAEKTVIFYNQPIFWVFCIVIAVLLFAAGSFFLFKWNQRPQIAESEEPESIAVIPRKREFHQTVTILGQPMMSVAMSQLGGLPSVLDSEEDLQIKTPTNRKLLTNVAVVRMKKNGKRFEIACYKNKVVNWRNKTEKDINEVLQTATVFVNVSKGQLAKREDLVAAFEMDDQMEICKMILEKGDLQVSDKERAATTETSIKEIANLIANMCVNSETKRPYSSTVIEKALRDAHFNYKSNRNAKQQALEAIPKLRESMNIERAKMRIRVSIGAKDAKNCHDRMKALFETVEVENWEKGALDMVGLVDPGHYRDISEIVQGDKKSKGELELLSLKVVSENEVEIS